MITSPGVLLKCFHNYFIVKYKSQYYESPQGSISELDNQFLNFVIQQKRLHIQINQSGNGVYTCDQVTISTNEKILYFKSQFRQLKINI